MMWFKETLQRLFDVFSSDTQPTLLDILLETYREEATSTAQLTQAVQRMSYPHFQERLLRLVDYKHSHAQWLQAQLHALGGTSPQLPNSFEAGENGWECLRLALEAEQRLYSVLRQRIQLVEQTNPDVAEGLRRIRGEKQHIITELTDLWLKSFPYAVHAPTSATEDQQKHTWLEQEKMSWLDQKRAEWEAEGKPSSWAEWIGEREFEWQVIQLPTRELEWAKRKTEQEAV
jgi:hypothetical protein